MYIKFKNEETLFLATAPIETKLFDSAKKDTGWLLGVTLTVYGDVVSEYVDAVLSPEAISEIIIYNEDKTVSRVIKGYQKVNLAVIKYTDDLSVLVDIQLTKWTGTDNGNKLTE